MTLRVRPLVPALVAMMLAGSMIERATAQDQPRRGARSADAPLKVGDDAPSFVLQSTTM